MQLSGIDGAQFSLTPVRYEFPGIAVDQGGYDANWLLVNGEVRTAKGAEWAFRHPCLLAWEAIALEEWLGNVGSGDAPKKLDFVEPLLQFRVTLARGRAVIAIEFDHEAAPLATGSGGERSAVKLILEMGLPEVAAAAKAWSRDLIAFPVRESADR